MKIYTLKNCDTCKKALKWLEENGADFQNHDIRADGLERETVENIVNTLGWETALNRRSTTWRQLSDAQQSDLTNAKAIDLITNAPTLMKRPVFVFEDRMVAGFNEKSKTEIEAGL